ncbi:hypothetical protein BN874_1560008 [Candidatus Contendobacter odensis Run_B_J11]|uniref:Uncharacterized protein n=1 Tax=Candidatus Contendobacter odensis Run_B_J11 TaxID=1400861 RepID=A0A7U7J2I6_9GAMM|nr:hypothetical protein BN874_1560008 [Candidatus Contendobacter odensis Run_B_J11]
MENGLRHFLGHDYRAQGKELANFGYGAANEELMDNKWQALL